MYEGDRLDLTRKRPSSYSLELGGFWASGQDMAKLNLYKSARIITNIGVVASLVCLTDASRGRKATGLHFSTFAGAAQDPRTTSVTRKNS
jgi:hypothetical protein